MALAETFPFELVSGQRAESRMTEDEKRQQRAMVLLEYEETRVELAHLRAKAWKLSEEIGEISQWLAGAREMQGEEQLRQRERNDKINKNLSHYRAAFDFDAIIALREELRAAIARLGEIEKQKKALGLGL